MIHALRISNFAVIEEAEVALGPGLTVVTGETGAGKSILVDALGLLLGGRAEADVVRGGCEEAVVEGLFAKTPVLGERLLAAGLPNLGEEVSVRRTVGRGGRGKAYVNGALVTIGVLGRLMRGLVDIAGQHEHMSLFEPARHRVLVDRAGGVESALTAYQAEYQELLRIEEALGSAGREANPAEVEFLQFQLDELRRIAPRPGEERALEEDRRRLSNTERLRRASAEAEALLCGGEGACLESAGRAVALLSEAGRLDPSLGEILALVTSAREELDEAARALSRYLGALEADPQRLAEVDERLDTLRRLSRKHGAPVDELGQREAELAAALDRIGNRAGHLERLQKERAAALERATSRAAELTAARSRAAQTLAERVKRALTPLMGAAEFAISLTPAPLGPDGADQLEFLFSANAGEPPRPLAKVASGGEASRLLLALRQVLSELDECRCYVLDEADAGVGGAAAEVVGRMIKEASAHRQVLCITHLPQVAAFADAHLRIEKEHKRGRTQSKVVALAPGEARAFELARMLSGVEVTREALGAAQALMRSALRSAVRVSRSEKREGKRARRSA